MNKDKWDSLPKDIQKVFTEVSKEAVEWHARAWWYTDISGLDYFLNLGGGKEVIRMPPAELAAWEGAYLPATGKYIKSAMERIPQLGSPCWTRSSVMCGSSQLGFRPHKPIWRAFQKDPKLVEKWGKGEYPITEEVQ
jgi:hypothetical protein